MTGAAGAAGRRCSWPAAADYQGYFQRASPPAPRGAADLRPAARAGHGGGRAARGWRGDLLARYRIPCRFAREIRVTRCACEASVPGKVSLLPMTGDMMCNGRQSDPGSAFKKDPLAGALQ